MIPRGTILGRRVGEPPKKRPRISFAAPPAAAGWIAVILATSLSTKGRCRIGRRIGRNDQEETPLRVARLRWPDYPLCRDRTHPQGSSRLQTHQGCDPLAGRDIGTGARLSVKTVPYVPAPPAPRGHALGCARRLEEGECEIVLASDKTIKAVGVIPARSCSAGRWEAPLLALMKAWPRGAGQ